MLTLDSTPLRQAVSRGCRQAAIVIGGETLWLSCAIIYPASAAGRHVGPWQRAGVLYQTLCKSAARGGRRQHCLISFRHSNNLRCSDWYLYTTKHITPAENPSEPSTLCVCVCVRIGHQSCQGPEGRETEGEKEWVSWRHTGSFGVFKRIVV